MSQVRRVDDMNRISRVLCLGALLCVVAAGSGCGMIGGPNNHANKDPLHLGVTPGPLGSPTPQTIQLRIGSEPTERIVSLSLAISSVQATNSGAENLELLTAPVTIEFTRSALVSEPILVRDIYQDTYSELVLPTITGQVVFYDNFGQQTTQPLSIPSQSVTITPKLVLAADPLVLSVTLDLAQSFTVNDSTVTVNPLVVTIHGALPAPPVAPAVGQPETGSVDFLVGTVTAVDTNTHVISLQPFSGDLLALSYDNGTVFENSTPGMLTGMMVETQGATQSNGVVMATKVSLIDSGDRSELYGLLGGYAPDGINYNLIVEGGVGFNVTTDLIGENITIDWLGASYSKNDAHLDLSGSQDLVFDEDRTFPGQYVAVQGDTLVVPDPDSSNAGLLQPRMFELQEQTITGQVSDYVYDPDAQTGSFTLRVAGGAPIMIMNPGLISVTVRQIPQTFLRNSPTFADGDQVKVRGLLFVDPKYSNANYHPLDPVAFIMVADRISK